MATAPQRHRNPHAPAPRRGPDGRPSARQRGYTTAWERIRAVKLAQDPHCEYCLERGECHPAEDVDHVVPLSEGGTHALTNLKSTCRRAHNAKTRADARRRKGRS